MIQINDKIRIVRLDENNLQIEEYRKIINSKTKEPRYDWVRIGYYGTLKQAISGVLTRLSTCLVDEDICCCSEILKRLEDIREEMRNAVGK